MQPKTNEEAKKEFSKRLNKYRKEKQYTGATIAYMTSMSASYMHHLLVGKYKPSLKTVVKLAVVLEVNEKDLLEGLEYWIKPKGIKFKSKDLTEEEYALYYMLVGKTKLGLMDTLKKPPEKKETPSVIFSEHSVSEYGVHDNSLNLLGVHFKDTMYTINVSSVEDIENDTAYRITTSEGVFCRKTYRMGDKLILIPYSNVPAFKTSHIDVKDVVKIQKIMYVNSIVNP